MRNAVPPAADDFTTFYRRYRTLVLAIATRLLRQRPDAEDAVQRVFLKVWTEPDRFRGGNIESWLTTVTKNICVDELRRVQRERRRLARAFGTDQPSAEDEALSRVLFVAVSEAVRHLSPQQRQALFAAVLFDQTHSAIAAYYGVPLGTVKTRIRSGIAQVRRQLRSYEPGSTLAQRSSS